MATHQPERDSLSRAATAFSSAVRGLLGPPGVDPAVAAAAVRGVVAGPAASTLASSVGEIRGIRRNQPIALSENNIELKLYVRRCRLFEAGFRQATAARACLNRVGGPFSARAI